jgi:hypothetical protein
VAWLPPPELAAGVEPELKPPEFELELLELEPELLELEPELLELEPVELELLPELEPELVPVEPELPEVELDPLDVLVFAEPGSARASAPAVTTLATVTAVVVDRTLDRPRSLAATARRIPSFRRASLMSSILRSGFPGSLHKSSGPAMKRLAHHAFARPRLPAQHEGHLKRSASRRRADAAGVAEGG